MLRAQECEGAPDFGASRVRAEASTVLGSGYRAGLVGLRAGSGPVFGGVAAGIGGFANSEGRFSLGNRLEAHVALGVAVARPLGLATCVTAGARVVFGPRLIAAERTTSGTRLPVLLRVGRRVPLGASLALAPSVGGGVTHQWLEEEADGTLDRSQRTWLTGTAALGLIWRERVLLRPAVMFPLSERRFVSTLWTVTLGYQF